MDRYVRVEQAKTEQSSIIDNEVRRSSSYRAFEAAFDDRQPSCRCVSWPQAKFVTT